MKRKQQATLFTQMTFADFSIATVNATANKNRKMVLMDVSLPAMRESEIKMILKANELSFPVPSADHYNCWGYVAFTYKWEKCARWIAGVVMDEHLKLHTTLIPKDEAVAGDIVVFRCGDRLNHTALLTHEHDIICHKPGQRDLCVDTMKHAISMYGDEITYARANGF